MTSDLFAAVAADDRDRVRALLERDDRLAEARNDAGVSVLLFARYRALLPMCELILAADPVLDPMEAATFGRLDRLHALLDEDPAWAGSYASDGYTPLHLAAFFGQLDAARLLLDRGAPVNAVSRNEMLVMPLHSAVAGGDRAICRLLIAHGALVNARQQEGWTPLHGAAQHGDDELVDVLLAAGADPATERDGGETPAQTAALAGHNELSDRLRSLAASASEATQ